MRKRSIAVAGVLLAGSLVMPLSASPALSAVVGPSLSDFVDIRRVPPGSTGVRAGRGSFVSQCGRNQNGHRNSDNHIVAPGVTNGAHHVHDYVGNRTTNGFSTDQSLAAGGTTCRFGDRSAYFWPIIRLRPDLLQELRGQQNQNQNRNQQQNQNNQQQQNQDQQQQQGQDQGQQQQQQQQPQDQQQNLNQDQQNQQNQQQDPQNQQQDPQQNSQDQGQQQAFSAQNTNQRRNPGGNNQGNNQGNQGNNPQPSQTPSQEPTQPAQPPPPRPGEDGSELGGAADGNIGRIVTPRSVTLQFRGNPASRVVAMPRFLRLITGDAKAATNGGANARAQWSCTGFTNRFTTQYPLCPRGSLVVRQLDFPSCWDGQNTDSANHRTHVVFPGQNGACPAGTRAIPQLRMTLTYQLPQGPSFAVDAFPEQLHNPVTDHADFHNVMSNQLMNFVVQCINRGQRC
ncbi:hypothetical protein Aple_100280 [Acrocarpospora pleiomorpha]|uniref:DUF1996 domain-containing protein n=1 Tax=Acrocarpospora pleiomorpha TaxID=90975 RepID=A0A5M3Y416_9ACTN|nr:DUF1996 domain-containing protein [Acrocarpospora pleiomorpha]GES27129.1 hypothetical protein Aple_100280 [Acrocarpospora pleiomorpha]